MDKARIAEWMLSLVVLPDRAASMVGDWMEDAGERGSVWFWSCVFRSVVAGVWSDLTESPVFMAGLGLRSFAYFIFLLVRAFFVSLLVITPVCVVIGLLAYWKLLIPTHQIRLFGELAGDVGFLACEFQTGRWIARRAAGREAAACVAFCFFQEFPFDLTGFLVMQHATWSSALPSVLFNFFSSSIVNVIAVFAGALWVRRRSLRSIAG